MLSFAPPGGGGGGGAAEAARGGGRGGGGARGGGHAGGICPLLSPDWSEPRGARYICPLLSPDWSKARGIYVPSSRLTGPSREVYAPSSRLTGPSREMEADVGALEARLRDAQDATTVAEAAAQDREKELEDHVPKARLNQVATQSRMQPVRQSDAGPRDKRLVGSESRNRRNREHPPRTPQRPIKTTLSVAGAPVVEVGEQKARALQQELARAHAELKELWEKQVRAHPTMPTALSYCQSTTIDHYRPLLITFMIAHLCARPITPAQRREECAF
eukprot:1187100-Prorocentrum_minimum.AAC.1